MPQPMIVLREGVRAEWIFQHAPAKEQDWDHARNAWNVGIDVRSIADSSFSSLSSFLRF
jgi:hypothetical protein